MKTLTVYALMLGTGVLTLLSVSDRQKSFFTPLSPLELDSGLELEVPDELPLPATLSDDFSEMRKKEYHIYFENRSDAALDVAIRYKDYNGDWQTEGFVSIKSGEKKHMGVSDTKTYFYYAESQQQWKKRKWKGKYNFPLKESDLNKLRFIKQDIWECYDTKMCNTFAVFR